MAKRKYIIQSLSAFLLMLVLLFSITPKKFLHDLIADHTDTRSTTPHDGHDYIDHHGFNCDCDNLVATSPFVSQVTVPEFFLYPIHNSSYTAYTSVAKGITVASASLRGPPALL